jgi:hypothetical protein
MVLPLRLRLLKRGKGRVQAGSEGIRRLPASNFCEELRRAACLTGFVKRHTLKGQHRVPAPARRHPLGTTLKIRIGEVEIDYEGTEEFLKEEIPQLLETAMKLYKAVGGPKAGDESDDTSDVPSLTTTSIAAKLSSKSGSDLLLAAAARLALVEKTEPFSRQQLLLQMQAATSYYKTSYSANLSKYIKTALLKEGPLSETAKNAYALKAAARTDLEKRLAND